MGREQRLFRRRKLQGTDPADRLSFGLDAARWKALLETLDAQPRPLPRLERLLKEPGFFDVDSDR